MLNDLQAVRMPREAFKMASRSKRRRTIGVQGLRFFCSQEAKNMAAKAKQETS